MGGDFHRDAGIFFCEPEDQGTASIRDCSHSTITNPPMPCCSEPSGAIAKPVVLEKFVEIFLEFVLVFLIQF
jgi:hypothetical protein